MNSKEVKKSLKDMKEFTKEVTSSKRKAKAFLIKVGIATPKGNLTKTYK